MSAIIDGKLVIELDHNDLIVMNGIKLKRTKVKLCLCVLKQSFLFFLLLVLPSNNQLVKCNVFYLQ